MQILLSTWLLAPLILLPTVTAFYPYDYGDDSTSTLRTRRTSQLSRSSSKLTTLPLRRVPTPISPRQNIYNIVNSKDLKQENSVAIDQDGGDLSYMVAVTFGDSKEEYHLLLDSAASNTWVMGQDCESDACRTHTLFGEGDSSTLKTQNEPFNVTYGTGTISGTLAEDTIHIGSLSPSLTFGLATSASKEFKSYPMDGILGIGRGSKVEGTPQVPQVMEVLSSSNLIGAKLYGVHLSRAADGLDDGELNFGEVNKDRFDGDLNWNECVENETGFWEIPVTDAGVDGKSLGISGRTAIMDTGTSFIFMPPADALAIHSQISGYTQSGENFTVPCDTNAVIQFSFNEQFYNISTVDWRGRKLDSGLCRSNIIGRKTFSETQWIVGDVFLKNVYSVFDFEGSRVGLGVKGGEESEQSTVDQANASSSNNSSVAVSQTASAPDGPTSTTVAESEGQKGEKGGASTSTASPSLFAGLMAFASILAFM